VRQYSSHARSMLSLSHKHWYSFGEFSAFNDLVESSWCIVSDAVTSAFHRRQRIDLLLFITARCTIVRLSVRLSITFDGSGSHRLEILETNCAHN